MKQLVFFTFFLFFSRVHAQTKKSMHKNTKPIEYTSMRIGDQVPELTIKNLLNYSRSEISFSNLKGKVVILDFWNKYCSNCIAAFPKMQRFKEEFGDSLEVLLVTSNTKEELKYLFEKSPNLKNNKLPVVLGDSVLIKLFPHTSEPFHVWIDQNGKIVATTSGNSITSEKIRDLMAGVPLNVYRRKDQLDYDEVKPLIIEGAGRQWEHLEYYSMFMKRIDGTQTVSVENLYSPVTHKEVGVKITNMSLAWFYFKAYGVNINSTRLIFEGGDDYIASTFFEPLETDQLEEWRDSNLHSYEIALPISMRNKWQTFLKQDLIRYFGFWGEVEDRMLDCLVLYKIFDNDKLASRDSIPDIRIMNEGVFFKSLPISTITYWFTKASNQRLPMLLDETGIKGLVDLRVKSGGIWNLENLRNELSEHGLGIKKVQRSVKCLVLRREK